MSDHDALLRAIGEQPEEDTPRLMYADWLEEQGESDRADFVRNQVELGRCESNGAERHRLVKKNVYYLTNFVRRWRDELPRIPGIEWGDFNRGLIEEVRASHEAPVLAHAGEIFAVSGIHVLRLWQLSSAQQLALTPELVRLRSIQLISGAPAAVLRELLDSPQLERLTTLDLHGSRGDNRLAILLASGRFPGLVELRLSSNQIGDHGAQALAQSPHLDSMRALDLRNNPITDHATRTALRRRFKSALKL